MDARGDSRTRKALVDPSPARAKAGRTPPLADRDRIELHRDVCYRALVTRDARFDGRFFTAVVSTGIFCRPICPARTPKIDNCIFLPSAAAAHQMGFRPCLRCRPEVAPGLAGWRGTANTVSRALGLIAEGGWSEGGADELANRLGVGARHLRRLFDQHVGASPVVVAQAHRLLFAKKLITETTLDMTEIALASGFGSVRRFNDAFLHAYGRPPSALRRSQRAPSAAAGIVLQLPFTTPYDWPAMLAFLEARAIPRVEVVSRGSYARSFVEGGVAGSLEVAPAKRGDHLVATIRLSDVSRLAVVIARLRRLFDLDADIHTIDAQLSRDPALAQLVAARPGIRVPGAWDPFELAVRAVLGQQVSVSAATRFAGRIAASFGEPLGVAPAGGPDLAFPTAETLAQADLGGIGLTRARTATLHALARTVASDPSILRARDSLEQTVDALRELPGIGPWTAHYVSMRALREPDAFPEGDLGLLRALETSAGRPTPAALQLRAEAWRPWRAYAAMRLWMQPDPVAT
jgi:AraC family transcriptional regulator of adaptative response / DNA-3-methyladenine glycosylase II